VEGARFFFPIVRGWLASLRWSVSPDLPDEPAVFACWHRDLVAAAAFFRDRPVCALVSPSRDGQTLVSALSGRKLTFVRGSSSRAAVSGARSCLQALRCGRSVATTGDGPLGPAGVPKAGPAWLAERSGRPLVPLRFTYGAHLRLGDWSRLVVPLPFTRIGIASVPAEIR
jgi:lysophospholipid acyltransferase (LPLAT)-like uncharacterized protein